MKAAREGREELTSLVADALALEELRGRGSKNWERLRRSNVASLCVEAWDEEEEALEVKRVSFATECTPLV